VRSEPREVNDLQSREAGAWFTDRKVLISPISVSGIDWDDSAVLTHESEDWLAAERQIDRMLAGHARDQQTAG
jgi:hypothetical protein